MCSKQCKAQFTISTQAYMYVCTYMHAVAINARDIKAAASYPFRTGDAFFFFLQFPSHFLSLLLALKAPSCTALHHSSLRPEI